MLISVFLCWEKMMTDRQTEKTSLAKVRQSHAIMQIDNNCLCFSMANAGKSSNALHKQFAKSGTSVVLLNV